MKRHPDCRRLLKSVAYLLGGDEETTLMSAIIYVEKTDVAEVVKPIFTNDWPKYQQSGFIRDELVDKFLLPIMNNEIELVDTKNHPLRNLLLHILERRKRRKK